MEKQHSKPDSSSLNFSLLAANPWEHDGRTVTSIRNSLILAEQMGLKTLSKEFGLKCPPVLAHLQSSQLIALQREIAEKNRSLIQIKQAIANHSQEKETAYFTHVDVIENRISMIKELCTDFDLILKNPDVIIHRLQKPYVGDYIEMNAAYHKFAKEVFMQLVSTLNDLSLHLDNITWAANTDFSSSHLEPLLVEVQSLTASMQTSYHTLSQMRKGVELLRSRGQDLSDVDISEADSPQHDGATPRNIKGDSEGVMVRPRLVCGGGSSKVKE